MRPWKNAFGIAAVVLLCAFGASIIIPVFASARAAARMTREQQDAKNFIRAIYTYTDAHQGSLPGKDWREQIVKINPELESFIRRREDPWWTGIAAIPGTQGKRLDDLPDETVLFVGYRAVDSSDILNDLGDVGDIHREGSALAVTAASTRGGGNDFLLIKPTARIGFLLGRQGAPGLK